MSTIVGVAAGFGVAVLIPPTYEATGSVVLNGGAVRDPVTGQFLETSLARNLVPTIARLAESREVGQAAAAEARVPTDMVVDHVSAEFEQGVQIITIKAHAPTAALSASIANAVTHALGQHVEEHPIDGTGSVDAQPLDQATPSMRPILPKPFLDACLGGLLGSLAGIGMARARDQLDDKISDIDELRGVAGAPILASIPFDRRVAKSPLSTDRPYVPWAEAFAQLRTNLEFLGVDSRPRIVAVTSAAAGEGKSITSCNLAIALARAGRRVLLIEADLRRPACSRYLGVDGTVGLTNLLAGNVEPEEAIQRWGEEGLMFLSSGWSVPNPSELLASRKCQDFLREMREQYDTVVLDLPSLLPTADAAVLAGRADGVILLARHRHTRAKQIRRAVDALTKVNAHLLGCALNMVPPRQEAKGYGYGYRFDQVRRPEHDEGLHRSLN
ncbi:polysaccharide biosynthesis tyrosine autokinase [Saccharopolyspora mangrovi]|uniref:Polysaccharide biosynthesis tyrosine autokinase n=1 Tax=Saccharopolyspora mangrovi TaxID=3082379 RepID=A0ABU6AEM1_9PSEU|nr:polysaccharide biosynthesis tyrosine autokinase [Saccharopolyspora sp. S2-29]MEB3369998.1 polysaccharide biosynthesis tyrosine autokinase [Saccharopolyspora sp. S2-29]